MSSCKRHQGHAQYHPGASFLAAPSFLFVAQLLHKEGVTGKKTCRTTELGPSPPGTHSSLIQMRRREAEGTRMIRDRNHDGLCRRVSPFTHIRAYPYLASLMPLERARRRRRRCLLLAAGPEGRSTPTDDPRRGLASRLSGVLGPICHVTNIIYPDACVLQFVKSGAHMLNAWLLTSTSGHKECSLAARGVRVVPSPPADTVVTGTPAHAGRLLARDVGLQQAFCAHSIDRRALPPTQPDPTAQPDPCRAMQSHAAHVVTLHKERM